MLHADQIVETLRRRGELWESAPGLVALRGDVLALRTALERLVADAAAGASASPCDEWATPPALALETLARASYFASFPQWLTLAAHLSDDADALRRVAESPDPVAAARNACAPAGAALPPAVCYHVYAALADRVLHEPAFVTVQNTCWRHEGDRLRPLARGWAFTMREAVCVGDADTVAAFRRRGEQQGLALATTLGLGAHLEEATDPFFAPTAGGRQLLQRLKGLKRELLLPVGEETVAAASFNHHEQFFGECFDIRFAMGSSAQSAAGGMPAQSACVAYGVERWLLAFLAEHGIHARGWPALPTALDREVYA